MVITRKAMVPATLKVESCQVQARVGGLLLLKEMVGHLVGDELVQSFHGGCGHTTDQIIQHTWTVNNTNDTKKTFKDS